MKIHNGLELIVDALEWREDWEFDHPTMILSPVLRYSPNGTSPERMVEELLIDASIDMDLKSHDDSKEFDWRGWSVEGLKRIFTRSLLAKKSLGRKSFTASQYKANFFTGEDGYLTFSMEKL